MSQSTPWRAICYEKTAGLLRGLGLGEDDRLRVQEALANAYSDGYTAAMGVASHAVTRLVRQESDRIREALSTPLHERQYRGDPCTVCEAQPTVSDVFGEPPAWGRCGMCCEEICPKHQRSVGGDTVCSSCAGDEK